VTSYEPGSGRGPLRSGPLLRRRSRGSGALLDHGPSDASWRTPVRGGRWGGGVFFGQVIPGPYSPALALFVSESTSIR